jgi:FAD:protein FMN transferase
VRQIRTRSRHEPVLGTILDLQATIRVPRFRVRAAGDASGQLADRALSEFDRLSKRFSVYDVETDLCRWRSAAKRDETVEVGPELARLLSLSARWQVASRGLYNPSVGVLTERWKRAERDGVLPSTDELADLVGHISTVPYSVDGPNVTSTGNCAHLSFNSFAKGLAIDHVVEVLWQNFPLDRLIVNVGGDLYAESTTSEVGARVGIEHPTITHSNEPPVKVVSVTNAGLATSGSSHRGFTVNGERFSHLIDPRTGWPVADTTASSVTIVAHDAATADVLATVAAMGNPSQVVEVVEATAVAFDPSAPTPAVGAVTADLLWFTNTRFDSLVVS